MAEEHKEQHGDGSSGKHGGEGHGGGHGAKHGGGSHGGGAHEEHEGAPEWLISFADNVALMMGFFVVLLAMNMEKPTTGGIGGQGKFPADSAEETPEMQDFAIALRKAFNHPVDIDSRDPREQSLVRRLRERAQSGGDTTKPGPSGNKHDLQSIRPSDYTNIQGFITFPEMTSTVTSESEHTIETVAEQLRGTKWIVEVRGHVSALEAMRDKEKAIRLGFERAYAAATELAKNGLSWEQMRIVSCADHERATPLPSDRNGHANNQRAEIVVTPETMPPDPYSAGGPSGVRSDQRQTGVDP